MAFMRIGETAKQAGVSAANIRYYEREGLLTPSARQDNDYRCYSDADVHRLRFIRMCRAMDMSLDEVRSLLALDGQSAQDCKAAASTIGAHLQHVRQRLKELRALEKQLQQLRALCDGQHAPCNLIAALHAQADVPAAVASKPPPKRHV